MIAIDTNILIRYVIGNDAQSAKAADTLLKECSTVTPGFICSIVLCELVWVLDTVYNFKKEDLISVLGTIISSTEFFIEHHIEANKALLDFVSGNADFADYYIAHISQKYGVEKIITFDRKAGKHSMFELIQ